jgi:AraC-like DNA-binding protein
MRQGEVRDVGAEHFEIVDVDVDGTAARFVERCWSVRWDLPDDAVHEQRVLAHPTVTLIASATGTVVVGPPTATEMLRLSGRGFLVGAVFRPAGFRPFLGRSLATIADATVPLGEIFPGKTLPDCAGDARQFVHRVWDFLDDSDACIGDTETTSAIVEHARADRMILRVDELAAYAGMSVRLLERRFVDHVGLSPKAVIRRFRLQEVVERARMGKVDWATLASDLGYSDQAHLTRDFRDVVGVPPATFHHQAIATFDCADSRLRYRRRQ